MNNINHLANGSKLIHFIRADSNVFFFIAMQYSIVHMYHNFLFHSSANGHLSCFYVLTIVNSAAINIGMHVYFSILASSRYMTSSGIAGLYGAFLSSFLRHLHSGCICLHSQEQCKRVPLSSHPLQYLLFMDIFWWPFWLVWDYTSLWFWFPFL